MKKMRKSVFLFFLVAGILAMTGCMEEAAQKVADRILSGEDRTADVTADAATEEGLSEEPEKHCEIPEKEPEKTDKEDKKSTSPRLKNVTVQGEKRIVGYYTSWSAYARNVFLADMDPSASGLTHLNFAFANLSEDGSIAIGDSWVDVEMPMDGDGGWATDGLRGHFRQMQLMKEKNPELKTLISVGGWTWSGNFSAVAADPGKRKKFAQSAVRFITDYGFDGIDIDWEFPVEGGDNIAHLPEDRHNYTLLLKETREALDEQGEKDGRHYLLTIAGGPNPTFVKNTEIPEMAEYLDFINVMTYDYHGGWENVTGHNAPLYASEGLSVDETVQAYLDTGVDPSMLNLGLAFYGRGWTDVPEGDRNGLNQQGVKPGGTGIGLGSWEGGVFDYCDLEENYLDKNGYERFFDPESMTPYLYNGKSFVSYDDRESIGIKVDYALARGLGGVMYWEFSGDKNMTLQDEINRRIGPLNAGEKLKVSVPDEPESVEKSKKESGKKEPELQDTWNSTAIYNGGEEVNFEGHTYRAKWWTQNEKPDPDCSEGVWEKLN